VGRKRPEKTVKFKSSYLVVLMLLFVVFVFFDQNQTPVPIKFVLGSPSQLALSLIIAVSLVIGAVVTLVAMYLVNRKQALMNKK
jgi:uncharacterized integral membrane protein